MRKLRLGVWVIPNYRKDWGGAFFYQEEMIKAIKTSSFTNAEIIFLSDQEVDIVPGKFHQVKWKPLSHWILWLNKLTSKLPSRFSRLKQLAITPVKNNKLALLSELNSICDVIYYLIPMCKYPEYPFLYTLWDIGHLNSYNIPSLNGGDLLDKRRLSYEELPKKALLLICESEAGKKEAIHYLRINENRIRVLPLFPSAIVRESVSSAKPSLLRDDEFFIHYPAQFWAHKNHYNLLLAFKLVIGKFPHLKLIFTGSDQGNKDYIVECIHSLGLTNKIIVLGYVSLEELKWLYEHSKGLVMPTFLGPTNMPPVEAMKLNCPVAVSDIPGHREQLGEYAFYFNPLQSESIAGAITTMVENPNSKCGLSKPVPTLEGNMLILDKIISDVAALRHTWN